LTDAEVPGQRFTESEASFDAMSPTIEISQELKDRIDRHLDEDDTYETFLEDLVSHYEVEGRFLREGYSGEP
jgi:hypothetical protein